MDFFSYLQNSGIKKENRNNKEQKIDKINKSLNEDSNSKNSINSSINKNKVDNDENEKHISNHNFKRGETVKIIRYENSIFNLYKGYYAEIKQYKENSSYAYVILPAMNYPSLIKIPIVHFMKIDN